jgi:hypothetical protein
VARLGGGRPQGRAGRHPTDAPRRPLHARPLPEIRKRLLRYFDAGLETAFLALSTTEPDPPRKQAIVREALRVIAS